MRFIAVLSLSTLVFASVANAVTTEPADDPYTDNQSVAVTLEGSLNAEGKVDLSWDQYLGQDLKWYKIVHSQDNPDAYYPVDGYVEVYTDPAQTTYTHTSPGAGVNYYRVCVITTADLRGCSNTVTVEAEGITDPKEIPVSDPYTDDETIVVTLEGSLNDIGNTLLEWSMYEGGDLKWYKIVHSQENPEAYYPVDGYIEVYSDPATTMYKHTSVPAGVNYYRVCVITTDDRRGCSNTVTLEKAATETFPDVETHWAKEYVDDLASNGIVEGVDGMYEPEKPTVRAEAVKLIMLGAGFEGVECDESIFPDLKVGDWFCGIVTKAYVKAVIQGDNGYLYPARNITRAEALKALLKAKGIDPPEVTEDPFPDVKASEWYAKYDYKAFILGYVEGVADGNFEPNRDITRAELAKIVSLSMK